MHLKFQSLGWLLMLTQAFLAIDAPVACAADAPPRVLRLGMPGIPETLDPARSTDVMESWVMAGIYEALYLLDPLARPAAIVPFAAAALPEVSADYRTFTIRVRPGAYFTPHSRFGGKARELTAADFAYAIKRVLDPAVHSPSLFLLEGKIEGLDALAMRAKDAGQPLDYDVPVTGLVVVDRWTLRIRLTAPDPAFPFFLALPQTAGVAREVVEAEGSAYGQRPIGSGAFVVDAFTPGQRVTLMRNRSFRAVRWDDLLTPESMTAHSTHPMRGKTLPGFDRIDISTTPESSTQVLALRNGELDIIYLISNVATENGELKPELAREGLMLVRIAAPIVMMFRLSMLDAVLGGNAREKIALRRAILMAFDDEEWIRVFTTRVLSIRDQLVPPGIEGHIPGYRNPNRFDPAVANALLDRFSYKRGPDGYRHNRNGSALIVNVLMGTTSEERKIAEFTKRMLDRIGIRVAFEATAINEYSKRMSRCRYGMATMGWVLDVPDGTNPLAPFHCKAIGKENDCCFSDPQFNATYESALVSPPGLARMELFRTMQSRLDALAPVRSLPSGEALVLKRTGLLGPYGTFNDFIQLLTLSAGSKANPDSAR
jgi:oligopeptide transport system substrate-binding protein